MPGGRNILGRGVSPEEEAMLAQSMQDKLMQGKVMARPQPPAQQFGQETLATPDDVYQKSDEMFQEQQMRKAALQQVMDRAAQQQAAGMQERGLMIDQPQYDEEEEKKFPLGMGRPPQG